MIAVLELLIDLLDIVVATLVYSQEVPHTYKVSLVEKLDTVKKKFYLLKRKEH